MSHYDRKKQQITDGFETFYLEIHIHDEPRAQKRHRVDGRGKMYDPSAKYKKDIRFRILNDLNGKRRRGISYPLSKEVPVSLDLQFFMPIPKSAGKADKMLMQEGLIHHLKKPDVDNLEKALMDVLSGVLYRDDCQVWRAISEKRYTDLAYPYTKICMSFKMPKKDE